MRVLAVVVCSSPFEAAGQASCQLSTPRVMSRLSSLRDIATVDVVRRWLALADATVRSRLSIVRARWAFVTWSMLTTTSVLACSSEAGGLEWAGVCTGKDEEQDGDGGIPERAVP